MFGTPFRHRVESSPLDKANGNNLRLRSFDDNDDAEEERKANRKLAWFFVTVALLGVIAKQLGHVKDTSYSNATPVFAASMSLTLLPAGRTGNSGEIAVQFRVSNQGSHPVFYRVREGTNAPIGQIVARTSPSSEWMTLANGLKQRVPAVQEFADKGFAWIEMPPGGWVEGEFRDKGEFSGEHAYAIFLKPARDAAAIRIVSKSYPSPGS